MTLYEIKNQFLVLDKFIDDNDLSKEAFKQALDQIEGSLEDKVENYIKYMKNLQGEAEMFKLEEKRMNEKRKALENHADRLKTSIDETLKELGLAELKAGLFTIKYQKNPPSLEVIDLDLIPMNYKIPQEIKVDKKSILQDIKAGIEVAGVEVKIGESMRIR